MTAATLALTLAGVACSGGSRDVTAAQPAPKPAATVADIQVERAPIPADVSRYDADLVVRGVSRAQLATASEIAGIEYVAEAALVPATVRGDEVTVVVADPQTFRQLTPESTASSAPLWERVASGDAIFTHRASEALQLRLGQTVALSGPRFSQAVRIGALAANGAPDLADAVVSWEVGARLGIEEPNILLVAVAADADVDDVAASIGHLDGAEVEVRPQPEPAHATGSVSGGTLESFTYTEAGDGQIEIDAAWVRRNIVTVDLPVLGRTRCHRIMVPQLQAALQEVVARGLDDLITDYSGCYVPRHMLWDAELGISRHAWGLAFDINVPDNGYGDEPTMDPRLIEIFERWGFAWGGNFAIPDGMHFELAYLVTPA